MSGIGVNLRVTGHCNQGGRKYMEDMFSVAYQQTEDLNDLEYAFFGIFDGHGGVEAATYAKEHLLDSIVQQKSFWSDNDDDVLHAIHEGYLNTHQAMWKEQAKWQRTASGLPSTSGTTATVAFIMRSKIYVGHVGDSMLVLGYHDDDDKAWKCLELTKEHKPECPEEIKRITKAGGKVVRKNGVPRVVWNRPKTGHKGPVRRSTAFDEIPFLAVARALGDFWSYNPDLDAFTVSPEPDVGVIEMDTLQHKCLIFGTDGLWNVLSAQDAVDIVHFTEMRNEQTELSESNNWINPSKCLVDEAIEKWNSSRSRADNTSVVTLLIDPPGPPPRPKSVKSDSSGCEDSKCAALEDNAPVVPHTRGMAIFTRNPGSPKQELLNSLFKSSASSSSSSPNCSPKTRSIANILRPYEQIVKAKQQEDLQHFTAASSPTPPLVPSSSPSPSSSGSLRSGASIASSSGSLRSSASIASTRSSSASSASSLSVSPASSSDASTISSNIPASVSPSASEGSTRSSNTCLSVSPSASPSTRAASCSASISPSSCGSNSTTVLSTRSSAYSTSVLNSACVPSTRSSNCPPSISPSASEPRNNTTNVPSTRSSHCPASVTSTRSSSSSVSLTAATNLPNSASVASTRSSNHNSASVLSSVGVPSNRSSNCVASLPTGASVASTRSSASAASSVVSTRSSASTTCLSYITRSNASASVTSSSGRVATRVLTNQSASLSSTRRKRFRMDEKRSSLPLNMGFEESSGNSDTENEQRLSVSPSPLVAAPGGKMKRRHQSSGSLASGSTSHPPSPPISTRTLRSDTLASLPVKTLRSRNINLNQMSTPSQPSSSSLPCRSGDLATSRRLRWNKR